MGGLSLWVRAEWRRRGTALLALALLVALAGGVATALYAGARRADTAFVRFREATAPYNLVASIRLGEEKPTADELSERVAAQRRAVAAAADVDGVESVSVESWWAIRVYPESDPGTVVPFAIGTFATYGQRYSPLVIEGALPSLDDGDAVTVSEGAARMFGWTVGSRHTFETVSPGPAARMGQQRRNAGLRGRPRRTGDRGRGRRRRPRRVRRRRRPLSGDPFSRRLRPRPRRRDRPPRADRDDPR